MVFNATFNNISVISWWSVLLVEETGVPGENHRPVASQWQALSHNVVSSTPRQSGFRTHNISGDRHWFKKKYSPLLRTNFISSLILELSHMTSNIAWSCFHVSFVADLHNSTCSTIVLHVFSVSIW